MTSRDVHQPGRDLLSTELESIVASPRRRACDGPPPKPLRPVSLEPDQLVRSGSSTTISGADSKVDQVPTSLEGKPSHKLELPDEFGTLSFSPSEAVSPTASVESSLKTSCILESTGSLVIDFSESSDPPPHFNAEEGVIRESTTSLLEFEPNTPISPKLSSSSSSFASLPCTPKTSYPSRASSCWKQSTSWASAVSCVPDSDEEPLDDPPPPPLSAEEDEDFDVTLAALADRLGKHGQASNQSCCSSQGSYMHTEPQPERTYSSSSNRVALESLHKQRSLHLRMESARLQVREQIEEPDVELEPLPLNWQFGEYTLPVLAQHEWAPDSSVTSCSACDAPFKSGVNSGRHHCRSCGQIYCDACCPFVGFSLVDKSMLKFRACGFCVQTVLAVKKKYYNDQRDRLKKVFTERVIKAGGRINSTVLVPKHCQVQGCNEEHARHYCKICKSNNSNHFSSACPKRR